jgi:phosphoglycerate dehydrogenase-like enzyme
LQLDVRIEPMSSQIPRVARLTARTNQMNMSSVRRTEAEIRALDAECLTVHVSIEPPPENPLLTAKNCLITPHMACAATETRYRLMSTVIENVAAFLHG